MRHRLLDEEMAPGLRGALRDLQMLARRRAHEHGIRPGRERLVQIAEGGDGQLSFDLARAVTFEGLGHHVRQPATAEREQVEAVAIQRPPIARMPLSAATETPAA